MKTPPTPPEPIVAAVATVLATQSTRRKTSVGLPCRIRSVASKPLPKTCGMPIAIAPTIAPPSAIVAQTGSFDGAKSLLPSESARTKTAEAAPPSTPIATNGTHSTSDSTRNGATW